MSNLLKRFCKQEQLKSFLHFRLNGLLLFGNQKFVNTNSNSLWKQPNGYDTKIKIYNCITNTNVPLILRNKNFVTWYTCGPTVYDLTHIGHASCYVKLDIIQRILRNYFGINLITAMNITDIDDKILKKSLETNLDCKEITRLYENQFLNDLLALNVELPNIKIRVTENIPLIISFIDELLRKNYAYVGNDKSVYFNVNAFKNYGKLQKINLDEDDGSRQPLNDVGKKLNADFALWKTKKENESVWYQSPWGNGRPGWHIECSALASHIFGGVVDFHAGGLDLKFPHHENEEAQSCAFHNTDQWVSYWIHCGHLNLAGQNEKMSKSLKNTISVDEMLKKYTSDEFRMACLLSNYRTSMEFSDDMMRTAKSTLTRFISFVSDCQAYISHKKENVKIDSQQILDKLKYIENCIDESLKNDFNTAKCISYLLELIGTVSKMINNVSNENLSPEINNFDFNSNIATVTATMEFIKNILQIFGLNSIKSKNKLYSENNTKNNLIEMENLIDEIIVIRKNIRDKAFETKNQDLFKICDEIRENLQKHGIEIKDHKKESSWNYCK